MVVQSVFLLDFVATNLSKLQIEVRLIVFHRVFLLLHVYARIMNRCSYHISVYCSRCIIEMKNVGDFFFRFSVL